MKHTKEENTKLDIISMEEENANRIVFITGVVASIGAFIVVNGFLEGTLRDWIALIVAVVCVIIRFFEKKTDRFKKYAKYAYMTIPFWGTVVLIVSNDGKFAAVTQAYLMYLMLSISYYDVKMVLCCAGITIASTIGAFILAPEAMLMLDEPIIWFYIFSIYLMATFLAVIIAKRMRQYLEQTRQIRAYEDELVYLEQLEKKEEKQNEFIHNINHYFVAIGELARIENCEEIVTLVEELGGNLRKSQRIIYSRHKVLNAMISEKVNEASEQDIRFDIYVEPILNLKGIADGDLVAMFGNLLDNAIEAAMQCEGEKRKISLRIYMEKEGRVCVVKLVNYFATPRIQHKSGFISTKRNKKAHGIGLKSVEHIAGKYRGYLQCIAEEERFSALLILPVKDTKN